MSTTFGSVFSPGTTSTSGINCAGFQKCATTKRSGCPITDCSAVGLRPEVFVDRIASLGAACSTSVQTDFLMSRFSATDSMTKSTSATPLA